MSLCVWGRRGKGGLGALVSVWVYDCVSVCMCWVERSKTVSVRVKNATWQTSTFTTCLGKDDDAQASKHKNCCLTVTVG